MVNLETKFQEPFIRPGVNRDEQMSICSSSPKLTGGIQIPACWKVISASYTTPVFFSVTCVFPTSYKHFKHVGKLQPITV